MKKAFPPTQRKMETRETDHIQMLHNKKRTMMPGSLMFHEKRDSRAAEKENQ